MTIARVREGPHPNRDERLQCPAPNMAK